MEVTYLIVIALVTYIFGSITKLKIDKIPNKFIPIQNVIIGVVSAVICIVWKIEPDPMQAVILCLLATTGAGGIADLTNKNNYKKEVKE